MIGGYRGITFRASHIDSNATLLSGHSAGLRETATVKGLRLTYHLAAGWGQ